MHRNTGNSAAPVFIPVDPGPFVDPTEELAREAVRFCGYPVIGD